MDDIRRRKGTTVIRVCDLDAPRETYRFSTFGLCEKIQDVKPCETLEGPISSSFAHREDGIKTQDSTEGFSSSPAPLNTDILELYAKHHHVPKVKTVPKEPLLEGEVIQQQTLLQDEDMDLPSPPKSPLYDTIPKLNIPEFDTFSELPGPIDSDDTLMFEEQHFNLTEEATSCPNEAPTEQMMDMYSGVWSSHGGKRGMTLPVVPQVENESLRSAVYVNVSQLRKSISESPPSAPSSYSPSYLDPEGWEVHVDQESGQEYFYHPTTGRTTWDSPFLDSPTDPEPPCSPSPPQSPSLSPSSPPAWTSDWEQLVDESSGQPYFYNAMSGETSWEPPEQLSPYPPVMEPMSVHRFHEDGPPPLPDEDYPLENNPAAAHPESSEDLLAMGPPTLPKEYTLSHAGRTIIPRANLDRSNPNGWNLNVQPNGTWVFTNEHSPEQWIKSVDEQGQTYYYLRDGSKSLWNLPEVKILHYTGINANKMENGVEADNPSVIKNWRHTMGPAQMSAAHDDGRFMPTHKRNTSDYSSDSSSTGNSPEMQHDVQNLEKAGILNKTKVCDNGKKVRKNWAQTWTVLHGGVLTFHKDPKSATIGTSIKTNQIVPEITVDLRGATIGWAPKDKSSKKNVLELKGKNGVEFLVQYDTESIIHDWHKVLVDTIRQLEYQDHHSEDEERDLYEKIGGTERDDKLGGGIDKRRPSKPTVTHSSSGAGDSDQKRVRTKLMKFLMKRPTLQSVKEKGYIRDNVFGCHLGTLCAQERATVPSFVEKCIKAVEKRGLDIDGLYRVSGNLAVIQKLRFKADHEELDLEDGQWEDVHVITGALKLFFRELPEPLFPFSHFNKLIEYGEDNRMTVQNVAIVFGPTLLRPEMELGNITMHMVFQNQIVEFILNEYNMMFYSS
ncbi:hypothetical protein F7725_014558 [Dissostichus mawsoni]|uniref:Rho GTPase-activating protein 27-like n=1 Tax=Dissostichus mawsoni TaxID=36200 RepID=A0A7J5YWM4_DISMA|nr:hypothetical protein F7725_014558 [Dissostichus mawsoni]